MRRTKSVSFENRNGFEVKPQTPSYRPYTLNNPDHKRQQAFAIGDTTRITPIKSLSASEWNELAQASKVIPEGALLRDFQIQCSNIVIQRGGDVCLIAPTGGGKSLVWSLPLLAQKGGISLVITPYTSLGCEGESKCVL